MTDWANFLNNLVVVDTSTEFLYVGTLEKTDGEFIVLANADCHDSNQSNTTREKYLIDVKKFGVKPNRKRVFIRKAFIISISELEDIMEY